MGSEGRRRFLLEMGAIFAGASLPWIPAWGQRSNSPALPPPEAPPAASERTKQLVPQMSFEVPAPVEVAHSISYRLSTREDADQRRLDIYRNMSSGRNPVVIFVHGGAWRGGHRRQYLPFGVCLALQRITAVIPSFSQAPKYLFPEPVRDIAAVVRWVRDNIGKLGGDPSKIFLAGHSSGAQIASLVALDTRYLEFHYLPPSAIRGVIAISGIFEVPATFDYAFGGAEARALASPLRHVREKAPPFLLATGGQDSALVRQQNPPFAEALARAGVTVEQELYPEEDHNSMVVLASIRNSPLQNRIRAFVSTYS